MKLQDSFGRRENDMMSINIGRRRGSSNVREKRSPFGRRNMDFDNGNVWGDQFTHFFLIEAEKKELSTNN